MMQWNPYSPNTRLTNSVNSPGGYEQEKLRKVVLLVAGLIAAIVIVTLLFHFLHPASQQSKYLKSATAAAKKQIPNAKVSNLKVAGGFAIAMVSDPKADGQLQTGNTTIFKVNADGSMKQLANGSYLSPITLV